VVGAAVEVEVERMISISRAGRPAAVPSTGRHRHPSHTVPVPHPRRPGWADAGQVDERAQVAAVRDHIDRAEGAGLRDRLDRTGEVGLRAVADRLSGRASKLMPQAPARLNLMPL
jgi:hypothetical protein